MVIRYDPEIRALYRRYCLPARRYLKLGGALLRMSSEEYERFVHALACDARAVTDAELTILFEGSWRERRTAAWLAAASRRDHFRERLGALLLDSEVCCAGGAYCAALASFGTARDADLLAAYLDRYLHRPDLAYDQPTAMGALAYIDSVLHSDRASHFLQSRRARGGPRLRCGPAGCPSGGAASRTGYRTVIVRRSGRPGAALVRLGRIQLAGISR